MNLKRAMTSYARRHRSVFGVFLQQSWAAMFVYEKLILAHSDLDLVIELGSGAGGLSLYLAMTMNQREGAFLTIELRPEKVQTRHSLLMLEAMSKGRIESLAGDLYAPKTLAKIERKLANSRRALILCDGGDKPRELKMIAPLLKKPERRRDILMAHDWGTEVHEADIPAGFAKLQPWQAQAEGLETRQLILHRSESPETLHAAGA